MTRTLDFKRDLLPYSDKLFRLAMRITLDRAEAEDIAEEALLRVWQRRDELPEIENMEVYLLTICRRLALDHVEKKESQNVSIETHPTDATDLSASPLEQLANEDRLRWVRKIIDSLPEKQRAVIQLRDIEEKSVKETAEIMGISPEDVKTSHHRARRTIKEKLLQVENHGL